MNKYVIIGNSAAGVSAAETIREWDKSCKITIISDENIPFYSRCLLPNYLAGELSREDIIIRDTEWYISNDINLILGKRAIGVNEKNKKVILNDNSEISYTRLLIATGSFSIFPSIDGIDNSGVFGFRTISDADSILRMLPQVERAVVLGAGFIGLKVAYALWKRGIYVTVIEKLSYVLPRMLDTPAASIIATRLAEKGIKLITDSTVAEIIGKNNRVMGVRLDTGELIKCDLVIVAVGIKPNIELIENTGIKKDRGIIIDEYMKTNIPDIYAAGNVAEGIDFLSGSRTINAIWPSATRGGKVAGYNIVGIKKRYDAELPMNAIEFFGIPIVSMGLVDPDVGVDLCVGPSAETKAKYETVCQWLPEKRIYKKIILEGGKIVGMIFVGDVRKAGIILSLIKRGEDVSLIKSELLDSEVLAYSPMTTKFRNLLHYPI